MGIEDENIAIIAGDRASRAGEITKIDSAIRQIKAKFGEDHPETKAAKAPLVLRRSELSKKQNKARLDIAEITRQKRARISRCFA